MRILSSALLVVFVGAIVVFCVQNLDTITINYLGWNMSAPLPVLVLVVYLLGMVSGWGVLSFMRRSIRKATETQD
jgi:lipopolysaccharide assembly protein A